MYNLNNQSTQNQQNINNIDVPVQKTDTLENKRKSTIHSCVQTRLCDIQIFRGGVGENRDINQSRVEMRERKRMSVRVRTMEGDEAVRP